MFRLYVYFSCCHLIHFFLVELFSFRYMLSWYIMYILHWIFLNNKPGFKRLMLFVLKMLTGRDFLITGTSDCWLCFNSLLVLSSSFHKWSIFIRTAGICPLKLQWWVISLTQIWGALPSTVEPDGPHDRWPQREAFYHASGSACKAVLPRNAWLQESWIVRQTYWRNWLVTKSITLYFF